MRDTVGININAPVAKVASLFADPRLSESWMEDTSYEPISGEQGEPGSKYRLTMGKGTMTFTATVVSRDLPREVRLVLDSPKVTVEITATFAAVGFDRTQLTSDEVFTFHGLLSKLLSLVARPGIRKAHRQQMASFARFAETAL
jgi:hypothetical protein